MSKLARMANGRDEVECLQSELWQAGPARAVFVRRHLRHGGEGASQVWQAVTCICLARLLMKIGPFYISHCTGQYVNDKLQAWKQKRQNQPKELGQVTLVQCIAD